MEATSAVERVAERAASIQIERIRRLIVSDSSSAVTDIRERHRLNRVLVPLAQRARLVKTGRTPGWAMSTHARGCFSANFPSTTPPSGRCRAAAGARLFPVPTVSR